MKVLIYLIHPAHYHLFNNVISNLKINNHKVQIIIRDKDVLSELLKGEDYITVKSLKSATNKFRKVIDLIYRIINLSKIIKSNRPDIICSCASEMVYLGQLYNIPSLFLDEDDLDLDPVKLFANLTFPFTKLIIMPNECRAGRWKKKVINYSGYHELAYLHPNHFKPNKESIKNLFGTTNRYFILRFSGFNAYHDSGVSGISFGLAQKIIDILKPYGEVYITSEKELTPALEKYRIQIHPKKIHDALFYSDLFIGDSQTMAMEASVLGVPNIRFNGFACTTDVTVLEEIEKIYNLSFGINQKDQDVFLNKIKELVSTQDLKKIWVERRNKMLLVKIDVALFMTWLIENYPQSVNILKKNPDFQKMFNKII